MLSVLGRGSMLCDGLPRREILRISGLSLFGSLSVPCFPWGPHLTVPDRTGQPMPIAQGADPVKGVLA